MSHRYITDAGADLEFATSDGHTLQVGRYAVWRAKFAGTKAQVIATSSDLEHLKQTFGDLPVYRLKEKQP